MILKTNVRGTVLPPTVEFNVTGVDFGQCSFGFLAKKTVELRNTSEIALTFHTRFDDGTFLMREFSASPSEMML